VHFRDARIKRYESISACHERRRALEGIRRPQALKPPQRRRTIRDLGSYTSHFKIGKVHQEHLVLVGNVLQP